MDIVAIEPRLLSYAGGHVRLFFLCEIKFSTCLVRFRRWCIGGTEVLEQIVEACPKEHFPYYYVDCHLSGTTQADAVTHISFTISRSDHPQVEAKSSSIVSLGQLLPDDIAVVAPHVLQANSYSRVVVAIRYSPWLATVLPLLVQSSSLTIRLSCITGSSIKTFDCGASLRLRNATRVDSGQLRVAAYLQTFLFCMPECQSTLLDVSLNGTNFVRCEAELSVLPLFAIIHTLPPVINSMDTAGLVVLCSSPVPLTPVNGQFPDMLPKCWHLEITSWCDTNFSCENDTSHSDTNKIFQAGPVLARLPVILSQPRKEEISMLDGLMKLRRHKYGGTIGHGPKPFNSIELALKNLRLVVLRSVGFLRRFALCDTEVEIDVSCHDTRRTISLGNLWMHHRKPSTACQAYIKFTHPEVSQHASMKAFEAMLKKQDANNMLGESILQLQIAANALADIAKSVLELCIVFRRQICKASSCKVYEIVARGSIPVSVAESNGAQTANLDMCHPLCRVCELDVTISTSDIQVRSMADTKSANVYAFRSCGVQVIKHNIKGGLLLNLRAKCHHMAVYESSAVSHWDFVSSRWQVHAFDKQDWMVQEAVPESSLIEREVDVEIRGSGFKYALESSLRVCIELENSRILQATGMLVDDRTIIFKTPSIDTPQMAQLRVAFDFGKTTLWSNPVSFQFFPYPKLQSHWPPFLPNSTGGTLSFHGDFSCKVDALRVFLFSPLDMIDGELDQSVVAAASKYSSLIRHPMKQGIAPAFAAAMQVRAAGGTSAAAAAAAGAASITTASGSDFENIRAMVADAVRATGGTKVAALVASHAAIQTAHSVTRHAHTNKVKRFSLNAGGLRPYIGRSSILDDTRSKSLEQACAHESEVLTEGSETLLFGYKLHQLANLSHDHSCRYIDVASHLVDSSNLNCVLPPNLPVYEIHAALSRSLKYCREEKRTVYLFTVRFNDRFCVYSFVIRWVESGPCVAKLLVEPFCAYLD